MAEYYVISPSGEKYGPASVDLLNEWAGQDRILSNTLLEEVETGRQCAASEVIEIRPTVPTQMTAQYPRGDQYEKIQNHMVKAIIATTCCCLPLGIASIVYSSQVDSHARRGDMTAARNAAAKASLWANVSIGLGLAYILFNIVVVIIGIVNGESSPSQLPR